MENSAEGGSSIKSRLLKGVAIIGGAAALVAAAKGGLLSDNPEDYQGPVGKASTQEIKHEPNPYLKKPVVKGFAPTIDGNVIEIDGIGVNPNREVRDQYYSVRGAREKLLVYASPDTGARPIPVESLKEYGIDLSQSVLGQAVYGEPYGDPNNPDNILGNKQVDTNTKAGEYWELKGKNAQGQETTAYLDIASSQVVSERPVIKMAVGQ